MYILNTTFIVHRPAIDSFNDWVKDVYVKAAHACGVFDDIKILRIMSEIDPETVNYAVQLLAPDLSEATRWHDETAAILKDDIAARMGDRVLSFSTYMEIVG